jgi:lysyl-tRNA synthetase class 2
MTYRAAATLAALQLRAAILQRIRAFFAARGVLEVETPALSAAGISDVALDSMTARARSLGERKLYLHTSPEFAMKRLLAAGSGDIYQVCRVFRDDELGRWHQPEFTMLEWYRQDWDEQLLMREVEALFADVLQAAPNEIRGTSVRMTYSEAFRNCLGVEPTAEPELIHGRLAAVGVDVPAGLTAAGLLDLAFGAAVVPRLPPHALTFVDDFPATHAALARLKPQTPPVAARFEVFAGGIELANGFAELNDAHEQRRRFAADLAARAQAGREQPPLDEAFLAALERLPACAGVAVGVDRLVALAAGFDGIAAAMSFVHAPAD